MKVKFFCNSGANIHSCKESNWFDVEEDLNYTLEDWKNLSEDEKYKEAEEWAWGSGLDIYYEEQE